MLNCNKLIKKIVITKKVVAKQLYCINNHIYSNQYQRYNFIFHQINRDIYLFICPINGSVIKMSINYLL